MTTMKINHTSAVLRMNTDCRLLLPDKVEPQEKLKVIWLCHGGSGDENEWLYHATVSELADSERIAMVLVNANDSCFVDMAYGNRYGTYIGKELPQILYTMFPCLSDKREDNYVSGLSNGGYGSLYLGLTFPEQFGAIGAFSAGDKADSKPKQGRPGTMSPQVRMFGGENFQETPYSVKFLAKQLAKTDRPKPLVYHACGSLDPWLDLNLLVKDCFETLQCPEYHYVFHQPQGLGHEWKFWDMEIRRFLDYLKQSVFSGK